RRSQLAARPFGPGRRAQLLKGLERLPERLSRVGASPSAAEPLAEAQQRPRKLERRCRQPVQPQGLLERRLVAGIGGKQAAAAGGRRLCPGTPGRLGESFEGRQGAFGVVAPSRPYVGLDQVRGPLDDRRLPQAARFGLGSEAVENPYRVLVATLRELQKAEGRERIRDYGADPARPELDCALHQLAALVPTEPCVNASQTRERVGEHRRLVRVLRDLDRFGTVCLGR